MHRPTEQRWSLSPFRSELEYLRYQRFCLWCGRRLGDHVLLCSVAAALRAAGIRRENVDVVFVTEQVQYYEGKREPVVMPLMSFDTLSELMRRQAPPRNPVGELEWEDLQTAWAAVTANTPEPLRAWLGDPQTRAFRLRDNLRSLIRHYPSLSTGLDHWLQRALQYISDFGPRYSTWFSRYMANQELDRPGSILPRVLELEQKACRHPLVLAEEDGSAYPQLTLTPLGREVLQGRVNFLELNGIDRWVGGVHLCSDEDRVWVRDGERLRRLCCKTYRVVEDEPLDTPTSTEDE
jgi:hypothetical protein